MSTADRTMSGDGWGADRDLRSLPGGTKAAPTRWRKLPVEIEAWRVQTHNLAEVAAWCGGVAYNDETPWDHGTGAVVMPDGHHAHVGYRNWGVIVPTLEGDMLAKFGWWIIKGVKGEFYPCDPGVFEATYEPAQARGLCPAYSGGKCAGHGHDCPVMIEVVTP